MDKVKTLRVASDKSISHRAVILSSIAQKKVAINNYLFADDTLNTIDAFKKLGVDIVIRKQSVLVNPKGKYSLMEPNNVIDMGNSGTGMRLMAGLLSGARFFSVLTGDDSLRKRPMMRIIAPLKEMGSEIISRKGGYAPLCIKGNAHLKGINYKSPVASAQVKSAILLAGLYSEDGVCVDEPVKSRNHTENMLRGFGVDINVAQNRVCLGNNRTPVGGFELDVPADISSAAFFMVLAALKKNSEVIFKDVILNRTRSGILDIFAICGVKFEIANEKMVFGERIGDIYVKYTKELRPFTIDASILPRLIDEIPILSILALFCDGVSEIKDAKELRVKESDRISAICENLKAIGADFEEFEDGLRIKGGAKLHNGYIATHNDHRIAMSFSILKALLKLNLTIDSTKYIKTSYPNFFEHLEYVMM